MFLTKMCTSFSLIVKQANLPYVISDFVLITNQGHNCVKFQSQKGLHRTFNSITSFTNEEVGKIKVMCPNLLTVNCTAFLNLLFPICSVQFSCSVMSDSLGPHGLQHTRLPCPSQTPGAYSNSVHRVGDASVIPFLSRLQYFPVSRSFPLSWFFASGGQSIGVSQFVDQPNFH